MSEPVSESMLGLLAQSIAMDLRAAGIKPTRTSIVAALFGHPEKLNNDWGVIHFPNWTGTGPLCGAEKPAVVSLGRMTCSACRSERERLNSQKSQ